MEKIKYKTRQRGGVRISITPCTRLKRVGVLVGTGSCMACSYCYDIDTKKEFVLCRKKLKTDWKPCGQGKNICNCKKASECGYLKMGKEIAKLHSAFNNP